ncbi:peptidase inhibitor family I36 protein [Streptomyces europaeiscabiei]|uniref:peptidase inhibitor family I36 protein n=1 Tax=Streptomyces europaeiscabiei TaxID=146819 RepID=UPI002E13167C|nr:peptidase inhibitor family I36 protein [Streptomyces europaeiscabiei]
MTAAPANAAWTDCSSGALCAYLSDDGAGDPGEVFGDNSNLLQYNKFDNAESVYNNGNNCSVTIWNETGYSGDAFLLGRGFRLNDLDEFRDGRFADDLASNDWCA